MPALKYHTCIDQGKRVFVVHQVLSSARGLSCRKESADEHQRRLKFKLRGLSELVQVITDRGFLEEEVNIEQKLK